MNLKLALGTAQFGLDYGVNNVKGKIPKKEVFEILKCSLCNGIDTLDTAYAYGDSERIIGEFNRENGANFKVVSKLPLCDLNEVEKLLMLRNHGITKNKRKMTRWDGKWYYEQLVLGFNYRISDFQCALGFNQLKKLDRFLERRREIVKYLQSEISRN